MLTLIEGAAVYAPEILGVQSVLLAGEKILALGSFDGEALRASGAPCAVVDATDCLLVPGFIDPHEHLIGGGGEEGFGSRMPEVPFEEIAEAGVTTVVGCLGTDTTGRNLTALLAKARQLQDQGITAYMYTGGFPVPPPTITGSVTDDLVLVDRVIGIGEIAISDVRSSEPTIHELARLVSQGMVGGIVGGKAGVTHFHVGPGRERLSLLHGVLDRHEIEAAYLYATHISRSRELMDDAIALAQRGAYVDIDTIDEKLGEWLHYYRAHDGPMDRLTASSDAHTSGGTPAKLHPGFVASVQEYGVPLEEALTVFTRNPAAALKLRQKGEVRAGLDGDLLVLNARTLAIRDVFARGRPLVRGGQVVAGG